MKVLIVGDTHADDSFVANVHKYAKLDDVQAQTIVQVGDFGFGFGTDNMVSSIVAWLERDESHRWYWVDGNHDNHERLRWMVDQHGRDNPIPFDVHERLCYVPRGCVFDINGYICLGLGGAVSVDKERRVAGKSWWHGEEISYADAVYAIEAAEGREIDVMFTHDAPDSDVLTSMLGASHMRVSYKMDQESRGNRATLSAVVNEVKPKVLFHGHYHYRYRTIYTTPDGCDVQIQGIGANLEWVAGRQHHSRAVRPDDNVLEVEFS